MIQRKQSLFLLIAFILTLVCLCSPVAELCSDDMKANVMMYNLWLSDGGKHNYSVAALFVLLIITLPINIKAIFSFNDRKLQSRLCLYNIILSLLWYVVLVATVLVLKEDAYTLQIKLQITFPLISLILHFMARRAIIADERLVRAADRIR